MANIQLGNNQVPVQDYNWTQAPRSLDPNPGQNLNLAASGQTGQFGTPSGNTDYAAKFGTALQGLLKQYQQLGTKPMQTQALNASDAQTNASTAALTNPALQGYAPSTINNASSAAAKPFDPIIQGAQNSAQTFGEQIKGFGDVLNNAQNFLKEQSAQQEKSQANARDIVNSAMSIGSDAVNSLIKTNPDLVKAAGYDTKTLQGLSDALKGKETVASQQFNTIHSSSGSSGISGSITPQQSAPVVSPAQDAAVADIIRSNANQWGHAADAIDAQFGKGTATKYDSWLKSVYQQGQNIDSVYQPQDIGNLRSIDVSRLSTAANRIVNNYVKSGTYKVVSEGAPYLSRISAASQNPGSISDVELLDSVTKLNTGGNQVTEAQVGTILRGRSLADTLNILHNKLGKGGVLSSDQRSQLEQLASATYAKYLKDYTPVYKQATAQLQAARIPQSLWPIPDWNTLVGQQQAASNNSSSGDYNAYLKAIGQ